MITKVQGKTLAGAHTNNQEPKLTALEKAMLRWVIVDPNDKLLDANVGSGKMAAYLRRNMQCEVCGVSDCMEHVRYARSCLQNCDIVYAPKGDIPWRPDSFDTVLMRIGKDDPETQQRVLTEAKRVLKPGGQLILGARCYPAIINALRSLIATDGDDRAPLRKQELLKQLEALSFESPCWQRSDLCNAVVIAWKHKEDLRKALLKEE